MCMFLFQEEHSTGGRCGKKRRIKERDATTAGDRGTTREERRFAQRELCVSPKAVNRLVTLDQQRLLPCRMSSGGPPGWFCVWV